MDRFAAPTHSSMLRMLKQNQTCPRHSQHIAQDERTMIAQVRDARRRDVHQWWKDMVYFLLYSSRCKFSKFQAARTDPRTRRVLFFPHVRNITFPENKIETTNFYRKVDFRRNLATLPRARL